jgi:exodeoxyribonuclease VII small subunit
MTLEEHLERLEQIVAELESQKLDLAEALARFEEGVGHLREATASLNQSELRVKRLTEHADGAFTVDDVERDD